MIVQETITWTKSCRNEKSVVNKYEKSETCVENCLRDEKEYNITIQCIPNLFMNALFLSKVRNLCEA